jgi:AcrR family transcriptional regulator
MGIRERKEREKEARREEIIQAAEKIFAEKGVAEATMDDVAEAAELSKGTLYLYYRSKEDIRLAVTMKGMEILHDSFHRAVSTGEPVMKLIANLGEAYYEFFRNHRKYFRMFYFYENPDVHNQVSPEMLETCAALDKKIWEVVVGLIRRGIEEGMLHRNLDPLEAGVMLWSNSNGLMRLIDRADGYWKQTFPMDLEATLRKSNGFLVEAMMTDKAKELFPSALLYHQEDRPDGGTERRQ